MSTATPGRASAPADATLALSVTIGPAAGAPAAGPLPGTRGVAVTLGSLRTDLRPFARCDAAALERTGPSACPAGARIGSGAVAFEAYVGGSALRGVSDDGRIFRASGADAVVLYLHISEPAQTVIVVRGRLRGGRLELDTTSSTVSQGFAVALRSLTLRFDVRPTGTGTTAPAAPVAPRVPSCAGRTGGARTACLKRARDVEFCPTAPSRTQRRRSPVAAARRASAIRSPGCPPGGRYAVRTSLTFTDASTASADATPECS